MAIADVSGKTIQDLISLKGRVAVVTGGAHGIGFAICQRLAEAGASVLVAGHHEDTAQEAAKRLTGAGQTAIGVQVDASNSESLAALADRAVSQFGRFDVWVNNAGIYPINPVLKMSDDDWRRVVELDLNGVFFASREAARRMVELDNGGVIINLSSVAGYSAGGPGMAHYVSVKHGVGGLTKSLAVELSQYAIRVLALAPTFIQTPGTGADAFRQASGLDPEQIAQMLPLGRVGVPDDVARVALFWASDLAAFMTGDTLLVDAGQIAL
jgi:NAD(P)-dependent dehydrogenase (short-subunit alcohol dehydrogenase family)